MNRYTHVKRLAFVGTTRVMDQRAIVNSYIVLLHDSIVMPLRSIVNLDSVIDMSTHYDAARAARQLGVSRATLYSYVSRGLVRSRAVAGRRAREYAREDIERLAAQTRGRRDPLAVAQQALAMQGLPVLSSALCLIDGGHLYYRGRDAIELSREARFEDVAALLWDGSCELPREVPAPNAGVRRTLARLEFGAAAVAHLAAVAGGVPPSSEPGAVRAAGARILAELCALAAGFAPTSGSVAERLAQAFGVRGARVRGALDAALVLCADHELNASAFAARVVASAGATPFMAVIGALGALSGERHGGATALVSRLFEQRLPVCEGGAPPGFGHALYPDGDPRAVRLLELSAKNRELARAQAFAAATARIHGLEPSVDFGLVTLCRSFGLPPHAPFVLFALGRTAGWIGHILEQYAARTLIRPRARYVGAAPGAEPAKPSGARR
jgi:citrate synthase